MMKLVRQAAALMLCTFLPALFACGSSADTSGDTGDCATSTVGLGPSGCYCTCNDAMRDGATARPCTSDNQLRLKAWDDCICAALASGLCATECAGQCGDDRAPLGEYCPFCVFGMPPYVGQAGRCAKAYDVCDGS